MMTPRSSLRALAFASSLALAACAGTSPPLSAAPAAASPLLVEKRVFELPRLALANGGVLTAVRVGYETYGRLNERGDNAILVARSYSSDSHVAGRYAPGDASPGVFDAIVGPGKAIDTDRWFVVASDNLVNVAVGNPKVVTTGPASIDPKTGRPYGMTFPIVQIRDMVNLDKALLDSLGVRRLHAVFGASMGSMQAFEWSVAYPEFVPRVVAVLPIAQMDGYTVAQLDNWGSAITLDPAWKGGDYAPGAGPVEGLARAMNVLHTTQRNIGWGTSFGNARGKEGGDPASSWKAGFAAVESMQAGSLARARVFDANSVLYGNRAMQLFSVGGQARLVDGFATARAKFLLVPAKSDVLFFPAYAARAAAALRSDGREVEVFEIAGEGGHYDGVFEIGQAAAVLRRFLE